MTIIAWDGKTLAADKMAVSGTHKAGQVTKIHRWEGGLCGFSGEMSVGVQLLYWLQCGADPEYFPAWDDDSGSSFIVITLDGEVTYYDGAPIPLVMENTHHAIGCGRDYALAAMHLGKNAKQAVEVACALDAFCGNGIDTLTLKPTRKR